MGRPKGGKNLTRDQRTQSDKLRQQKQASQREALLAEKRAFEYRMELEGYAFLKRGHAEAEYDIRQIEREEDSETTSKRITTSAKALRAAASRANAKISLLHTDRPNETEIRERKRKNESAIHEAMRDLKLQARVFKENKKPKAVEHVHGYLEPLERVQNATVRHLRASEAIRTCRKRRYGEPILVHTTKKMVEFMAYHPQYMPTHPMIYHDDSGCHKSLNTILNFIENANFVDVQDHDVNGSPTAKPWRGCDAAAKIRGMKRGEPPVNCLDVSNPLPEGFALDAPAFTGMALPEATGETKPEDLKVGKPTRILANDLSSCQRFIILGSIGAHSGLHVDRSGVWTSVKCIAGRKLWGLVPPLTRTQFLHWARTGQLPEDVKLFTVLLEEDDVLIMPPGTIHFPYSLETVYMEGAMHMFIPDFANIIKMSLTEMAYPNITNEDPATQIESKVYRMFKFCERPENQALLGSPDLSKHLASFPELREKMFDQWVKSCKAARLQRSGVKGRCPCPGKDCNSLCHRKPFDKQTNQCIAEQYVKDENRLDEDMLWVSDLDAYD